MPLVYGLLAACAALITQLIIWIAWPDFFTNTQAPTLSIMSLTSLILLALIEEIARLLFAQRLPPPTILSQPDEKERSFIPVALFFGLGFAAPELFLNLPFSEGGSSLLPLLGVIMLHMTLSLLTFSLLKKGSRWWTILALVTALHCGYNLFLFY